MSTADIIIWSTVWIILGILGIWLTASIFAHVFQVKKKLLMQKAQIRLLYKMADQAGINKAELKDIVSRVFIVY